MDNNSHLFLNTVDLAAIRRSINTDRRLHPEIAARLEFLLLSQRAALALDPEDQQTVRSSLDSLGS